VVGVVGGRDLVVQGRPVKMPSTVSASALPAVSKTKLPLDGATHFHQTVLPVVVVVSATLRPVGSPASVAPTFVPLVVPDAPEMRVASAKASFGGGVAPNVSPSSTRAVPGPE